MTMMLQHGRFGSRRMLDSTTVALAVEPHSAYVYPADSLSRRDRFYGLHWSVVSDRHAPVRPPFSAGIFEHGGSDGTVAWADPSRGLLLIYLTQSRGQNTRNAFLRLIYAALERDPRP